VDLRLVRLVVDALRCDALASSDIARLRQVGHREVQMEEQTSQGQPPGWYPDPNDAATQRYWDGNDWTENRAPAQATAQAKTNGLSIAALVLGILWLYWIGSVLALVFGYMGKKQIDESGGMQTGRGMAVAGIVLGWIGVGTLVLFLVLLAVGVATSPSG
jgi:hypothetical protein